MSRFDRDLERWVLAALAAGAGSFDELLPRLPGVYPSDARAALDRLLAGGDLRWHEHQQATHRAPTHAAPVSPEPTAGSDVVPHPLDFDWRFAPDTIDDLVAAAAGLSSAAAAWVCLGAPSVLRRLAETGGPPALLLDARAEPAVGEHQAVRCTLGRDRLPDVRTDLVVMDPPWYAGHVRVFLHAAHLLCADGGHVLASLPGVGTRPGVEAERAALLAYAGDLGLTLVETHPGCLRYLSPPFEQRALAAAGLPGLPVAWRRGDLLVLSSQGRARGAAAAPPPLPDEAQWVELPAPPTRLKVRPWPRRLDGAIDPQLRSVVRGDVLPTVSRRDARRAGVQVWTATNRVFGCANVPVLAALLRARACAVPLTEAAARCAGRGLTNAETTAIDETARQLDRLVAAEEADLRACGWST